MRETKELLLKVLIGLRTERSSPDSGICYNANDDVRQSATGSLIQRTQQGNDAECWVEVTAKEWPKYSGNRWYPVRHPDMNPLEAYVNQSLYKWDPSTEYGRNRYELLEFLITKLEGELA